MKARSFLSTGALAIAVAGFLSPSLAAAQDPHPWGSAPRHEGSSGRTNDHGNNGARGGWRQEGGAQPAPPAPAPHPTMIPPHPNNNAPRNFGDVRARPEQDRRPQFDRGAPVNGGNPTGAWGQRNNGDRGGSWRQGDDRNRGGNPKEWNSGDHARDPRWSDQHRDGDRSDRNGWRGDHSGWRGDRDRDHDRGRDYRRDDRRDWDRNAWRHNDRYDWRSYRDSHRSVYRIGRYYAPYYGYSYRRIGIGFTLGSLFYGNRYWIDDPWYYRLPEVYGPYRWVRYYDDVLLVNIYTGEVVDVIYDFFW